MREKGVGQNTPDPVRVSRQGNHTSGIGYKATKPATLQSVGFIPESRNRPVENRVIC
jgi:hypothetical protein